MNNLEIEKIISDVPVSSAFRSAIFDCYSLSSEFHHLLSCYLLFGSFLDDVSEVPVTDRITVATLEGRRAAALSGNYCAEDALTRFQNETGIVLNISEPVFMTGKARTASIVLSPELERLYFQSVSENIREVFFISGKKFSLRKKDKYVERLAKLRIDQTSLLDAKRPNFETAAYLNKLSPRGFQKFAENLPEAREYVLSPQSKMSERKQKHQLNILNSLDSYFPPTYQQVKNSERLFAIGNSAMYLSKPVREILFKSCWKADLSNAHLVIAARLWGLDDLLTRIERVGKIWPSLLSSLQLEPEKKDDVKKIIYSAVYGMSEKGLKYQIKEKLGKEIVKKFLEHEVVAPLLNAREVVMDDIRANGGIIDAYGKWHYLEDVQSEEEKAVRTLLSRQIGSYEFRVMSKAAKVARESESRIRIPLWLHDGIYVSFQHSSTVKSCKNLIRQALYEEAKSLNLPLLLEDE